MSSNSEERGVSAALGKIPKVNFQRAFSCTVTVAGTGLADISSTDVFQQLLSQHTYIDAGTCDEMYVHEVRSFGTSGGYLSMSAYRHGTWAVSPDTTNIGTFPNCYYKAGDTEPRRGALQQQYDFGINGSTRPELSWRYPKMELINNPFIVGTVTFPNYVGNNSGISYSPGDAQKVITIQSTNTGGDALYIVQFDVTIRASNFIEIAPALGAAAFSERNVVVNNYKPSNDLKKKEEEGRKAEEMANKKRKIEGVKAMTLPVLDSA